MTACPKCGSEIEEGKAYCSNPACGAVPAPDIRTGPEKDRAVKPGSGFILLARLAALVITALALLILYLTRQ